MIYISHRGLINGQNNDIENHPDQIKFLLNKNINIEIDIRYYKNKLYLGHDEPMYEIPKDFLLNKNLWCHAKDFKSLEKCLKLTAIIFGIKKTIIQ